MPKVAASQVRLIDLEIGVQKRTAALRHSLEETRRRIAALEDELGEKLESDLGRGDPAVTSREVNRALLKRLREHAAELERALSRLSEGEYGTCTRCGRPIHPDRLAVLPDAKLCIECARSSPSST
jgi:RNA polymerase-binding transcription factor DksA